MVERTVFGGRGYFSLGALRLCEVNSDDSPLFFGEHLWSTFSRISSRVLHHRSCRPEQNNRLEIRFVKSVVARKVSSKKLSNSSKLSRASNQRIAVAESVTAALLSDDSQREVHSII